VLSSRATKHQPFLVDKLFAPSIEISALIKARETFQIRDIDWNKGLWEWMMRPFRFSLRSSVFEASRLSRPVSIFERSELRSSREDRKENGVKNLNGAKPFPKACSYLGFGNAYQSKEFF